MTLNLFNQKEIYQITLMSFVEDFRAKHSAWLESDSDSMTLEVLYFLKLHGFLDITKTLKTQSPVWYSKMLKAYLVTTMEEHLLQSTEFLPTLVIPLSANYLILATSPSHRTGKESTLSDILETEVNHKYFLSENQVQSLTTGIQKSQVHSNIQDTQVATTKE